MPGRRPGNQDLVAVFGGRTGPGTADLAAVHKPTGREQDQRLSDRGSLPEMNRRVAWSSFASWSSGPETAVAGRQAVESRLNAPTIPTLCPAIRLPDSSTTGSVGWRSIPRIWTIPRGATQIVSSLRAGSTSVGIARREPETFGLGTCCLTSPNGDSLVATQGQASRSRLWEGLIELRKVVYGTVGPELWWRMPAL